MSTQAAATARSARQAFILQDSIGYLINRAARDMQNALDKRLAPFGVTAAQWSILIRCLSEGPQPAGALTRQLSTDASAVTRLLDRLQEKGLVTRKQRLSDRRAVEVELTEKGEELTARMPGAAVAVLEHFLRGFSPTEVEKFRQFLQRLVTNGGMSPDDVQLSGPADGE